jgi:hypothetical protein
MSNNDIKIQEIYITHNPEGVGSQTSAEGGNSAKDQTGKQAYTVGDNHIDDFDEEWIDRHEVIERLRTNIKLWNNSKSMKKVKKTARVSNDSVLIETYISGNLGGVNNSLGQVNIFQHDNSFNHETNSLNSTKRMLPVVLQGISLS